MMGIIIFLILITVFFGILANISMLNDFSTKSESMKVYLQEHMGSVKIAAFVGLAFVLFLLAALLLTSKKWGKIKVFISYHHKDIEIVKKLKEKLNKRNLKVNYIPFDTVAEHDLTVERAQVMLKSSDIMLTLPGQDKSFVDAEVFAAGTLKKAIVFIKTNDKQTLPDTSFRGHPVFNYEQLYEKDFLPLNHFINFSCSHLKDYKFLLRRSIPKLLDNWGFILFLFLMNIVKNIFGTFGFNLELMFSRYLIFSTIAVLMLIFIGRFIISLVKRIKSAKIARQTIKTGKFTFKMLEAALGNLKDDLEILECLEKEPLDLRHK